MALTNYERQKRWREKHPGLAKLRRRKGYRGSAGEEAVVAPAPAPAAGNAASAAPKSKILEQLRALMAAESAKPPPTAESVTGKQRVYRNDFGAVITEAQWNELQRRKQEAAKAGYVLDEFSQ